jgi:hypothetical protein
MSWFNTDVQRIDTSGMQQAVQQIKPNSPMLALSNTMAKLDEIVNRRDKEQYTQSTLDKLKNAKTPEEAMQVYQSTDIGRFTPEGQKSAQFGMDAIMKNAQMEAQKQQMNISQEQLGMQQEQQAMQKEDIARKQFTAKMLQKYNGNIPTSVMEATGGFDSVMLENARRLNQENATKIRVENLKNGIKTSENIIKAQNLSAEIDGLKVEAEKYKRLGQKDKYNETFTKIRTKSNELSQYAGLDALMPQTQAPAPKQNTSTTLANAVATATENPENAFNIAKDSLYTTFKKGDISYTDNNDLKSVTSLIAMAGEKGTSEMFNSFYDEGLTKSKGSEAKASDYVKKKMLPALMAEASIGGTHYVTKSFLDDYTGDMVLNMQKGIDEGETIDLRANINKLMTNAKAMKGNSKYKEEYIKQNIKPLEYASKGKSGEFYKDDWIDATNKYNQKYTTPIIGGAPLSSEYGNAEDAMVMFQEYVNNYTQNPFVDFMGSKEDNMNGFINGTFPLMQLAQKILHPDKPLMQPEDMMHLIGQGFRAPRLIKGYQDGYIDQETESGKKLNELMYVAKKLKLR